MVDKVKNCFLRKYKVNSIDRPLQLGIAKVSSLTGGRAILYCFLAAISYCRAEIGRNQKLIVSGVYAVQNSCFGVVPEDIQLILHLVFFLNIFAIQLLVHH